MIHDPTVPQMHCLQGALNDLSQFHFREQTRSDASGNFESRSLHQLFGINAKRNQAHRERLKLYDGSEKGETRLTKHNGVRQHSKIVRMTRDDVEWIELDMGKCMMELWQEGVKKLYVFTSLEISLADF
eukprot:CAMPEP_0171311014 /NCGR_PEP_ID=MMETSP0816-20121228/21231_1 /TAXON_ID=420281 /ORGANISM="Proboscia inermis, Strain CCAP1064/1" /LENGTH=128 /DNA_ID=CAMNT_0011795495 /DNA_START=183 /DNA_END=569 /DNA_ORIENTATION=+